MRKYVAWIVAVVLLASIGVYWRLATPSHAPQSSRPPETLYDRSFFDATSRGSASSAAQILPEVVRLIAPRSAVDLGSGTAEWLGELRKLGVTDVMGVDGDWVDRAALKIPAAQFKPFDLRNKLAMDRTFDLAISVETAEHLPPNVERVLSPTSWPWLPSFSSRPRYPANAALATSTSNGRITGRESSRSTTTSLSTACG